MQEAAGEVPAHLERLLARADDGARRAPRRARADGRAGDELPLPVRHRSRSKARSSSRATSPGGRASSGSSAASTAAPWARCRSRPASTRSRRASSPTMPGVTHVPYPNPYRPLFAGDGPGRGGARLHPHAVRAQRAAVRKSRRSWSSRSRAKAATSCRPTGFLAGLRALCDEHGILLIFDEVQSRRRPHRPDVRRASTAAWRRTS